MSIFCFFDSIIYLYLCGTKKFLFTERFDLKKFAIDDLIFARNHNFIFIFCLKRFVQIYRVKRNSPSFTHSVFKFE